MTRFGLTPDELLAATWWTKRRPRYAARLPGLNVLDGETLALVGDGPQPLLDALADALPASLVIDGRVAARGGTVRIHAQQAARVGVRSLVLSDPFQDAPAAARALAVADLAGLGSLGLTVVVACADPALAALVADRVCLLREGRAEIAYPVVSPRPRSPADVTPVTDRLSARLASG